MIKTKKGSGSLMPDELPVLPLMSTVIFPLGISTIQVWYERNLRLLQARAKRGDIIGFSFARTTDMDQLTPRELSAGGTAAKIIRIEGFGEGGKQITVQGLKRIRLKEYTRTEPYLVARVEYLEEIGGDPEGERREANRTMELVKQLVELDPAYPAELYHICSMNADTPGKLADMIASAFHFDLSAKQAILEELDARKRLARLVDLLKLEIDKAELSKNVTFDARQDLERKIKEQVLREEMKTIKDELGNGGLHEREVVELRGKIRESSLPPSAEKQALLEVERLRLISTASAEYGMVRTHLDWLMSLPWTKASCGEVDIERLEAILSQEHFGQEKVKEGILQLFSIRKLRKDLKGIVLCFLGPAGTGKTSLAQAIAKALERKFVRVNLAGVRDEAEIKGRRSTYAEAFPGKILNAIREAECTNPLMMIEGIGKMGTENLRGDPAAALAEALDTERNSNFVDNYLGVPFDLSDVIFVTAASVPEEIPGSLFDLMEMIEFSGFIEEEKLEIAKKFILPMLLKKHGLSERDIQFTDGALRKVIRQYTVEAGIKSLQREMEDICRKCARARASKSFTRCRITKDNLEEYLGMPVYIPDKVPKHEEIGVAIGLAWTEAGGDLMLIEALKMKGSGQVIFTGQLGEIMKESIQAAHSYVRSKAEMLGINYDDFTSNDIHVHFPSGSIPKDGPSAGITVSLAIASVMSDRPIRNDMAMSGEISLRGRVLPVAGVREKASAAHRVGIRNVMLPKGNEKNLLDLPEKIKMETDFIFVERIEEVFKHALMEPDESQKGIEEILRRELGKMARVEKQKRTKRKKPARKVAKKP
ncbi:MAG: endopeptidase La [Candidatus Zixiibacteriota bacterium]|nr:MAG: endopeptidase La [candidate division Zixibacteria bacterium]